MAWLGTQYTVTGTAAKLTTVLSLTVKQPVRQLDIKAGSANAGRIFLGPSTVTAVPANARVDIAPDKAWSSVAVTAHSLNTDEVYIVGTASDIAYISIIT
jgi:hypothetical protein